ncbi:MAG: hypothetical protein FJ100_22630, partial [Deltaproteobacteria bacterium]|nr:hypothetical protein [Deltaproteobacteria bacterium]
MPALAWAGPTAAEPGCGTWVESSDALASGPAVRTAEATQILALCKQICAEAARRKPWGILDKALRLARLTPFAPPVAATALQSAATTAGAWPEHALAAAVLRGAAVAVQAQWVAVPAAAERPRRPAQVAHWSWLGPLGAEHGTAFARTAEPEADAMRQPTAAGTSQVRGRDGDVRWQRLPPTAATADAPIALHEWVDRPDDALAYAHAWVRPAAAVRRAWLHTASAGPLRVWLAGRLVADLPEAPAPDGLHADVPAPPPGDPTAIALAAGWTRLLVKAGPAGARIAFSLAVTDDRGALLPLESTATAPAEAAATVAPEPGAAAPGMPAYRDGRGELLDEAVPALLQMAWHGWRLPADLHGELMDLPIESVPADPVLALAHAHLPGEAGDRLARLAAWRAELPQSLELALVHGLALDADGQATAALRAWPPFRKGPAGRPAALGNSVALCLGQIRLLRAAGADMLASDVFERCTRDAPHRLLAEESLRKADAPADRAPAWFSAEALQRALRDGAWPRAELQVAAAVAAHPGRTRLW